MPALSSARAFAREANAPQRIANVARHQRSRADDAVAAALLMQSRAFIRSRCRKNRVITPRLERPLDVIPAEDHVDRLAIG